MIELAMKYFITPIVFVLCLLLAISTPASAASEAEYKKLSKSWTLNADGSQEFHYSMELTLFTHTAMNSTYGESFIVYNPAYQTLKINASYTKQKDGTIIQTPANAFVEVLPQHAANAPAYNNLKEMVIVHTGLELGATIYLDYTITSKAGYLPELDIYEPIRLSSPVKECKLSVSVPNSKDLHYRLAEMQEKPHVSNVNGQRTYIWALHDLKAMSRLSDIYHFDIPFFAATTYSNQTMTQVLSKQADAAKRFSSLKALTQSIIPKDSNDTDKLKAIYNYIQNSFAHIPLDLSTCGYRIRPFEDIVQSAYGTDSELIYVFQQLLKEAGLKADICAVFPDTDATGIGLKPTTLYISTKVNGKKRLLAPTAKATQTICFLRQYCPALNLSTGIMEGARFQPSPITYKADLTLTDMGASVKAEAAIAPFFLDIEGKTEHSMTRGDAKAQTKTTDTSTLFTYAHEVRSEKTGNYRILSLPDCPFSTIHTTGMLESERDCLLTLPVASDETYTYQIHLNGKTFCTPATNLKLNNSIGSVEIVIQPKENEVYIKRCLKLTKTRISPKEYPAYVELINIWRDHNYTQVLIK